MIFSRKNCLKIIFIALSVALCFTAIGFLRSAIPTAQADASVKTERFLPLKSEEYYALSSPIHAYSDDEITAVTENDKIILFTAEGNIIKTERTSLKQINRVNDNLLFADNGPLYYLPISNLSAVPAELKDSKNTQISGAFFDTNGRYLVTSYSTNIQIYKIGTAIEKIDTISATEHPVAVNSDSMFYVAGTKIQKRDFNDLSSIIEYQNSAVPTSMIADDEYIYYFADSKLYQLNTQDASATPQVLGFEDTNYDLGIISSPQGLAFKNGNLLIVNGSANGSVQEFKINGDTLEFTGYAIGSGLSAYNRVAKSASNIERYGKYIAALDDNKLTVIDTENCADYQKDGFINLFVGDAPDKFALGNGTILYSRNDTVTIAPLSATDDTEIVTNRSNVLDISYQSGKYYLLYTNGTDSFVVVIDESDGKILKTDTFTDTSAKISAICVTADVFGNIYIADNDRVYKNESANSYPLAGVKKLATDLAGNVFALSSDGKIYTLDGLVALDVTETLGEIKTFGINFDKSELYFLIEDKEEVYFTLDAGNISIKDVKVNSEFTTATTKKTELALYTVNEGANVFSVTQAENGFNFNGLSNTAEEYPLIAKIQVTDNLTLCALASVNGVVLVNENDLAVKTPENLDAPVKAYITTAVYAYAIPVTEQQNSFIIKSDEQTLRLVKGTVIKVNDAVNVLGKTFYDATATVGGKEFDCYIPADFTADMLAETLEFTDYTIEKVKATPLYKNADLSVELLQLQDGDKVKLLANDNGVLKIAVSLDSGEDVIGYIPENALAVNPSTIVRNVLIILAVFASLAGTVSFFLLRKKQ